MSFRILEKKRVGKDGTLVHCEDRLVRTNNIACVIDGATSKSEMLFDDKTQGKIAGELIEDVLKKLPKEASIEHFISRANKKFMDFYESKGLKDHMAENPLDRMSASLALYNDFKKEVWIIGDCQAIIGKKRITNPKLIDEVLSNLRSFIIELELMKGKTVDDMFSEDIGRNYIMKFLKEQYKFQNSNEHTSFSYGVLDGFKVNSNHIKKHKANKFPIVLASDGYPKIFSSLSRTEGYLLKVLEMDPLCFRQNKSTKGLQNGQVSYDDRAFLKIVAE